MKQVISNIIPEIDLENPLGDYKFKIEISPYQQIQHLFKNSEEIISIKIRPITEVYGSGSNIFENAWFPHVYDDIYKYLDQNFINLETDFTVSRGFLKTYSINSEIFAFVHFDTGPEIIFDLSLLNKLPLFYKGIFNLIDFIFTSIFTGHSLTSIKALSYELRVIQNEGLEKFEKSVVQICEFPFHNFKSEIKDFEDLIDKTLYNSQYKKLSRQY